MSLKDTWKNLDPDKKKKAVKALCVVGVLLFAMFAYQVRSKPAPPMVKKAKPVSLLDDATTLQKSLYKKSQRELKKRDQQMDELKKRLDDLVKREGEENRREVSLSKTDDQPGVNGMAESGASPSEHQPEQPVLPAFPPPPPGSIYPSTGAMAQIPAGSPGPPPPPEEVVMIGEIGIVSVPVIEQAEDKKKDHRKIYLPPSFMAATLLSGLDAPTAETGKGNPVPALLRIRNLAVLPNDVKADLKGCFVIASGYGDLATERANMQAVSLSCVTREGKAVIDQKIKGFLVDQDGKIGLQGRVVSRMGSAIARSMVAGFFGGMGDYISSQNQVLSTSPLGSTITVDPADAAKYGMGAGLATGFTEIQKFYLDLAKQAVPVIEIGATKSVTLVIEEGTVLTLRDPNEED
ncbi:TraB/VirB10 family protein [Geopsychrobacter electrodiphilus]|uniref:TraB/VirB10 family protein n=1 Tax=Geopsychrobacter electrodiphilus TaxID=225196 RepID=UPI00037C38CB|nr:TraB/VirB10 family protein [Geopsychrobacter electrodiphilus]